MCSIEHLVARLDDACSRLANGEPPVDAKALSALSLEEVLSRARPPAATEDARQALVKLRETVTARKTYVNQLPMPREVLRALGLAPGAHLSDVLGALRRTDNVALQCAIAKQTELTRGDCTDKLRLLRTYNFVAYCRATGVSLDATQGRTRLALVAACGDALSTLLLLQSGANPCAVDCEGLTAADRVIADCDATCRSYCLGCVHETTHEMLRLATLFARTP